MTTWHDQFGIEPTRDLAAIERWADGGRDLGIALNDLPADGPVHPAVQFLYPDRLVTICETTGQMLVSILDTDGDRHVLAGEVAAIVATWGCTFMVLRAGEAA